MLTLNLPILFDNKSARRDEFDIKHCKCFISSKNKQNNMEKALNS